MALKPFDPESRRSKTPTPMRPAGERVMWSTEHFIIMMACTTPAHGWTRVGKKLALIEPVSMVHEELPTRIDKRLKSIKQIIQVRFIHNMQHPKAHFILRRYWQELVALADKCEQLYPCHFLIKGVNYESPNTYLDDQPVRQP